MEHGENCVLAIHKAMQDADAARARLKSLEWHLQNALDAVNLDPPRVAVIQERLTDALEIIRKG